MKAMPAVANEIQPAIASTRGERLCGRGSILPAMVSVPEGLRARGSEVGSVPLECPDPDVAPIQVQQVERVGGLARAGRRGGACLDDERREPGDAVTGR